MRIISLKNYFLKEFCVKNLIILERKLSPKLMKKKKMVNMRKKWTHV